ncbi:hypothetical protein AYL99_02745 [Fonsecaea erecta]|uniref:Protein kinase domain-containing protein n=1 Tax=Fonsecaea erecta TaxID=1367422 RepID=A0A178ZUR8_9EURO|nr:hypothetical protein AYL99_02745 [Fonsecaea erecta]OAP63518.1 hypothetical protein AYL99_02745 [Fonsecaea erecta]
MLILDKFKFDHPELNFSRLRGTHRRAFYDPFYIECRANGSLIQQGLNGRITPFCYGWIEVSKSAELQVAKRFDIHPFPWNRPDSARDQKIRGILFEWKEGKPLSQVPINANIAAQARASLRALHSAQITHGALAAANFLVRGESPNQQVCLLDLSASISLPHVKFSEEDLKDIQQQELLLLEVAFELLSRLSINQGVSVSELSADGQAFLDKESQFIQHLWAPPQPTCWQG